MLEARHDFDIFDCSEITSEFNLERFPVSNSNGSGRGAHIGEARYGVPIVIISAAIELDIGI